MRNQLRTGILDALSTELWAGLFEDNKFPEDKADPFKGFMRSRIFIYALKTIFTGSGSAKGSASSGARSKAAKNNMTSLTLASLAYIATLVINYLEAPGLENDCKELLAFLNRAVFPHAHSHPRRINLNAGPGSMVQMAADARAARAARDEAAVAVEEGALGGDAGGTGV
ncbi:hypothetical protein FRC07_006626 [Ceratobasidium sp. 392]|nr:hypothetical protein FRC07_006626 [Ceratobasidium sp. 392]